MYLFFKRLFDIIVGIIIFLILLPLFVFLALILKFSAEGEVFYFQSRIGLNNTRFFIWKFATYSAVFTGRHSIANMGSVVSSSGFCYKSRRRARQFFWFWSPH